jgi:rhodanese-related sulfurtransferase
MAMFTASDIEMCREYFEEKVKICLGPMDVREMMQDPSMKGSYVIVDVRDREDYEKEHIPGAINIPECDMERRMSEIPKDKQVIVYCWSMVCHMAARTGLILARSNYFVCELEGGVEEWKSHKMPVEKGIPAGVR